MNDSTPLADQFDTSVDVETATPAMKSDDRPSINKSERVRQYLKANPEARNKDVAVALADYGITTADVGNVKTQLKKKAEKKKAERRLAAAAAKSSNQPKSTTTVKSATVPKTTSSDSSISMEVLDAALEFVNRAGSLSEAQNALDIIRRIKSL